MTSKNDNNNQEPGGISAGLTAIAFAGVAAIVVGIAFLVILLIGGVEASPVAISVAEGEARQIVIPGESAQSSSLRDSVAALISPDLVRLITTNTQNGNSNAAFADASTNSTIVLASHTTCSNDLLLSNYQTSPSNGQFVDITNASSSTISLNG